MSRNTVDPSLLKKPQKYFEAVAADIVNIKEQLATSEKRSDKTDKENAELQARFEKMEKEIQKRQLRPLPESSSGGDIQT